MTDIAPEIDAMETTTGSTAIQPLEDFFLHAVEENRTYYAARKDAGKFTSPLFKLVQRLKSYPEFKNRSGKDVFKHLNAAIQPDWEKLFPDVSLSSLEFITAWEQVNIPEGTSPLQIVQKHLTTPLKLLEEPICEGYQHYLGIAFYLQRLTPRRDILLPGEPLSGILTIVMGKPVSAQLVSYYCRQAKNDGYIKLVAKAHHPSHKAARYRFDLNRFTDTGKELQHNGSVVDSGPAHFSYGNQGIQGIDGKDGLHGNEESSRSCVLPHAEQLQGKTKDTNQQGEKENKNQELTKQEEKTENEDWNKNEPLTTKGNVETNGITSGHGQCSQTTSEAPNEKKHRIKRQSVIALWQSFMYSRFGWQEKLSEQDYNLLVRFGRRTDELGLFILRWAMENWGFFAPQAVGAKLAYPAVPDVAFFWAYQALAFNLWLLAGIHPEEVPALEAAVEKSTKDIDELKVFYALGEEVQFHTIEAQLEYKGLLRKDTQGWEVCGQVFKDKNRIDHKYCNDEEFRKSLRTAAK